MIDPSDAQDILEKSKLTVAKEAGLMAASEKNAWDFSWVAKMRYERIEAALHDMYNLPVMDGGIASPSVVADSLLAIKCAKVHVIRDETGLAASGYAVIFIKLIFEQQIDVIGRIFHETLSHNGQVEIIRAG
ncbi:MAG: hypothetical protein WCK63_06385 [Betaproteobacteria bacterium]